MMEAGDSTLLRPSGGGPPVAPQMARRVAILGAVALALFAVVFLRLWFLQVLTGDQSRREALDNRVRSLPLAAPRGSILDRNGTPIVVPAREVVLDDTVPCCSTSTGRLLLSTSA